MSDWTTQPSKRRRRRGRVTLLLSQAAVLTGLALLIGALGATMKGLVAAPASDSTLSAVALAEFEGLQRSHEETKGRLAVAELELERAHAVIDYSTRFRIPGDLSGAIYDAAVTEGVHPAVAFQLVRVESGFRAGAESEKGALGYTQIRLPTARGFDPEITAKELLDRDTNLRLGFRFLKQLMHRFDGDLRVALLAYNRGPTRVAEIIDGGGDPANGYSEIVLRGLKSAQRKAPAVSPPGSG